MVFYKIRFPSSFGHNRTEGVCTKYTENRKCKWTETQGITWKTHNGGKNHDSHQAAKNTVRKEYNSGSARATTSSTSLFATRGGGYKMEATTSLTLSLSLSVCVTCSVQLFYNIQQPYAQLLKTCASDSAQVNLNLTASPIRICRRCGYQPVYI